MDAPNPSAVPTAASRTAVHIGAVGMMVRDLDRVTAYYREVLGLTVQEPSNLLGRPGRQRCRSLPAAREMALRDGKLIFQKTDPLDIDAIIREIDPATARIGHTVIGEYVDYESGRKGAEKRKQFAVLFNDAAKRKFVWAPLRWKHAKIHRDSRRRILRPHQEAGYTSAVVTVAPDPVSLLQSRGAHRTQSRHGALGFPHQAVRAMRGTNLAHRRGHRPAPTFGGTHADRA